MERIAYEENREATKIHWNKLNQEKKKRILWVWRGKSDSDAQNNRMELDALQIFSSV